MLNNKNIIRYLKINFDFFKNIPEKIEENKKEEEKKEEEKKEEEKKEEENKEEEEKKIILLMI